MNKQKVGVDPNVPLLPFGHDILFVSWRQTRQQRFELTLFCIAGEQLQINQPHVYDCDVPESMVSLVPALADLCKKKRLSEEVSFRPMSNRSMTLTSMGGTDFISFAKGASFDDGKSGWLVEV